MRAALATEQDRSGQDREWVHATRIKPLLDERNLETHHQQKSQPTASGELSPKSVYRALPMTLRLLIEAQARFRLQWIPHPSLRELVAPEPFSFSLVCATTIDLNQE